MDSPVSVIKKRLNSDEARANPIVARRLLKSVLKTHSTEVIPVALTYLNSTDILSRKLACWCIELAATDTHMLAANSVSKLCQSANPADRVMGLKVISSQWDMSAQIVERLLHDNQANVRKTAVLTLRRLLVDNVMNRDDVLETLYTKVRDPDLVVQSVALDILEHVLQDEGGVVVTRSMASHLLERLNQQPVWCQTTVIRALCGFHPKDDDDSLDILNMIDSFLDSSSPPVVINALKYMINLLPQLQTEILLRAFKSLHHFLGAQWPPEIVSSLLEDIIEIYFPADSELLSEHVQLFLPHLSDPDFVYKPKLQILSMLITNSNCRDVVDDFIAMAKICPQEILNTLITAVRRNPDLTFEIMLGIRKLFEFDITPLQTDILDSLISLGWPVPESLVDHALKIANIILRDGNATSKDVCNALWIIGEYAQDGDCVDAISEQSEQDDTINEVFEAALLALVKLFLRLPASCQAQLGEFLQRATEKDSVTIRKKAMFYYSALKTGPENAKKLLLEHIP